MAQRKTKRIRGENTETIRQVLSDNPNASRTEAVRLLSERGVEISPNGLDYHIRALRAEGNYPSARGRNGTGRRKPRRGNQKTALVPAAAPVEVVEEDESRQTVPLSEYKRLLHNQHVWAQAIVVLATGLR